MPNNQNQDIDHNTFTEISGGLINLENFLKDQHGNINLIHAIALNDTNLYENQNYIKILNQNFNFHTQSDNNYENYEDMKSTLEEVQKNLNLLISEDTILHEYVNGSYCEIDIYPKVPKTEKSIKGISFKDQAIIMSMIEFSNYIVKMFDFMCCPKRNEQIVHLTKKIYGFLTQMITVADANDMSDNNGPQPFELVQLQTTLGHIVSEIRQLFALILCDAFNFAISQNETAISSWCEIYERNAFARNFNIIADETSTQTLLNNKSDAPLEGEDTNTETALKLEKLIIIQDADLLKTNLPNTFKWIGSTIESFIKESLRTKFGICQDPKTLKYGQFIGVKFAQLLTLDETNDIPETIQFMDAGYFLYNLKLKFKILASLKYLLAKNLSFVGNEGMENVELNAVKNVIWDDIVDERTEIQNKKNLIKSASSLKCDVDKKYKWEPDVILNDKEIFDLVHAYFKSHLNKGETSKHLQIEGHIINMSADFGDYNTNQRMDIENEIIVNLIHYLLKHNTSTKTGKLDGNSVPHKINCANKDNFKGASKSTDLNNPAIQGDKNVPGHNGDFKSSLFQNFFDQFCRDFSHFEKHNTNVYFPIYIALYRSLFSSIA